MYPYRKDNLTMLFFFACCIFFSAGYLIAEKKFKFSTEIRETGKFNFITTWSLRIGMILLLLFSIPYCYFITGKLYPNVFSSLLNLSSAYQNSLFISNESITLTIIYYIVNIIKFPFLILLYYFWSKFNLYEKLIWTTTFIWYYAIDLSVGKNRPILFLSIAVVIMFVAKICSEDFKKNKKGFILISIFSLLIILAGPLYFASSMNSRGESYGESPSTQNKSDQETLNSPYTQIKDPQELLDSDKNLSEMAVDFFGYKVPKIRKDNKIFNEHKINIVPGEISESIVKRYEVKSPAARLKQPLFVNDFTYSYINVDDPIFSKMPSKLQIVYGQGTYYLSHGFQGLTIGLRTKPTWSFGFGQTIFMDNRIKEITGIDVYSKTYVSQVNKAGYLLSANWGTAFLEFASDFTWVGTIFFMGILGFIYGRFWLELLFEKRKISLILFIYLTFYLFMITSWWQPSISLTDFVIFYGGIVIWIFSKTSYFKKKV
jgi:hypothetical protein